MQADALGDRVKAFEAVETDRKLMPGLPWIARLDGRCFHSFTRGMARPFDPAMCDLMDATTSYLVAETKPVIAYTQSDEISLLFDGMLPPGEPLFAGKLFKLTSVLAAMATARFVSGAMALWPERCAAALPVFDARVFQLPSRAEAVAAMLWRELDATKNAVSMAARAHFPAKRLHGLKHKQMQELLFQEAGVNFNDYPARFKRGRWFRRVNVERLLTDDEMARIPAQHRPTGPVVRTEIHAADLPPLGRVSNAEAVLFDAALPAERITP